MKYYILSFLSFLMISCHFYNKNGTHAAEKSLTTWANAYFNFDYEKALKYTTSEGEQWIRFAASNITEEDVSFIREQNPQTQINILNSQLTEGDTVCNASIRVSHFIQLGLSPQDNRVIDHADFQVQLVKRGDEWLVRMEGLPQSGMRNHD